MEIVFENILLLAGHYVAENMLKENRANLECVVYEANILVQAWWKDWADVGISGLFAWIYINYLACGALSIHGSNCGYLTQSCDNPILRRWTSILRLENRALNE